MKIVSQPNRKMRKVIISMRYLNNGGYTSLQLIYKHGNIIYLLHIQNCIFLRRVALRIEIKQQFTRKNAKRQC